MHTLCALPAIVPLLCENNTKNNIDCNTSSPNDHRCYSCQENEPYGIKTARSRRNVAKNLTMDNRVEKWGKYGL